MSLDFDVSKVKNYDVVTTLTIPDFPTKGETLNKWHPVTNSLIWATIPVGINAITEDNWREFYFRLNLFEKVHGPWLVYTDDKERYMTALEVYAHIGLHTNASNKSRTEFMKDLLAHHTVKTNSDTTGIKEKYDKSGLENMSKEYYQQMMRDDTHKTLDKKLEHFKPVAVE